jgi:hypothetical protein
MEPTATTDTAPLSAFNHAMAFVELRQSGRWMKFLAIVGFVFLGLTFLASLALFMAPRYGPVIGVVLLVGSVIAFLPVRQLFLFAKGIQKHEQTGNMTDLEDAFEKQKTLSRYMAFCSGLYLLVLLGGVIWFFAF